MVELVHHILPSSTRVELCAHMRLRHSIFAQEILLGETRTREIGLLSIVVTRLEPLDHRGCRLPKRPDFQVVSRQFNPTSEALSI